MARKTSGKRGSAIIVLMVAAAIAGSAGTASASSGKSQTAITAYAPAPAVLPTLGISIDLNASWAEASWAEE
jgi:hypothetical protein